MQLGLGLILNLVLKQNQSPEMLLYLLTVVFNFM